MRILLLAHGWNSLTQRVFAETREWGHEVSVELDVNDAVTEEAVRLFRPDAVVAPFLKRRIPESVWRSVPCLVVHPGPPGDRGPAALDHAVLEGARVWGVTVLEATGELDGGPVRGWRTFPVRAGTTKASLYRHEVTEGAVAALRDALGSLARGEPGIPADAVPSELHGRERPAVSQQERAIDWSRDTTAVVLQKIHASDGSPGVLDASLGPAVYLHDAHEERFLRGEPGSLLARRDGAVCRATVDGAVWLGRLRLATEPAGGGPTLPTGAVPLKLPATEVLGERAAALPEVPPPEGASATGTYREIVYEEEGAVGILRFAFANGAFSTAACERLVRAYEAALARPTRVLVLAGGPDFWSNGIDLATIEAAGSPADESWRNIQAIDDVARAILETRDRLTVSALAGNAGAGGAFLALAADLVWARDGVVLNPHYKNTGNLHGSEYWTYVLPRRVGAERAPLVLSPRLPIGTAEARRLGLVDACLGPDLASFERGVRAEAARLAGDPGLAARLEAKRRARDEDEARKPLETYRREELERIRLDFYGFDPSYHVARYNFMHKVPRSRTPLPLAVHRRGAVAREGGRR